VASRAWLSRDPGDLAAALALIAGLPAFAFTYGDLAEAVATVRELAEPASVLQRTVA
jgi:hypothetical protein